MTSFTIILVELADGESVEIIAAEVFVNEFYVSLLSPEQLEKFKRALGSTTFGGLTDVTYRRCITKENRYAAFPVVQPGAWFVVFQDSEATGVQLTTTRTKPLVDGGSG